MRQHDTSSWRVMCAALQGCMLVPAVHSKVYVLGSANTGLSLLANAEQRQDCTQSARLWPRAIYCAVVLPGRRHAN